MKRWLPLLIVCAFLICAGCGEKSKSSQNDNFDMDSPSIIGDGISSIPEGRTTTCIKCHGDGVCSHCNGDSFRDGRRCSVCNGTGNCDACGGVGSIEVLELDGKDYTVCTSCHGDGTCGVCDGTGRIVQQYSTLGRVDSDCRLCHGNGKCLLCHGTGLRELRGF